MKLVSVNTWNKFRNVLCILWKFQNEEIFENIHTMINCEDSGTGCTSDPLNLMNHQVLLITCPKYIPNLLTSLLHSLCEHISPVSISLVLWLLFNCSSTCTLTSFSLSRSNATRMAFPKCHMDHGIIHLKISSMAFMHLG